MIKDTSLYNYIKSNNINVEEFDNYKSLNVLKKGNIKIKLDTYYEDYTLYVYDLQGHLVWSTPIAAGQSSVTLPSGYFVKGKMYAAKYMPTNKMSRKDKWVKFMY